MKQFKSFIFDSYALDEKMRKIELRYSLDDEVTFKETITLPKNLKLEVNNTELEQALFGLHLIGGISYFKTCLPKKIEVRSGTLSKEQAEFWNIVYTKGLGEFFFKNNIDFRGLISFPFDAKVPVTAPREFQAKGRALIPIGGGKDSVVTIELMKQEGFDCTLFRLGDHPLIRKEAEIAGLPLLTVERELSPNLLKLNEEGALNGHVPISAFLSWLSLVTAIAFGFDAIIMSNESSANEGNTEYLGEQINHQWSKSKEFEDMFARFIARFITPSISYFSVLRPINELQIAKLFSEFPQYFDVVTSCNANWKIVRADRNAVSGSHNLWCGICPKCAFAFVILAAFVDRAKIVKMFGKNLLDEDALIPYYEELLGLARIKPFECVGTPQETIAAFSLLHKRGDFKDSKAMNLFAEKILPKIS